MTDIKAPTESVYTWVHRENGIDTNILLFLTDATAPAESIYTGKYGNGTDDFCFRSCRRYKEKVV